MRRPKDRRSELNTSFLQYAKKIHLGAFKRDCRFANVLIDLVPTRFRLSFTISSHSSLRNRAGYRPDGVLLPQWKVR